MGYTFTGWYADAGMTETITSVRLMRDTVVYAGWTWNNPFTDVSGDAWYFGNVEFAYQHGLMRGISDDVFSPEGTMTRAMFVTVLYRLSGDVESNTNPFTDIPPNAWYEAATAWAAANGIAGGVGEGRFDPDSSISREQLAAMLFRYAKRMKYDVSVWEDTNILSYNDTFDISEYAYPALQWVCGAGIMKGDDRGNLNPKVFATRAEAAALLERFLEKVDIVQ